jgi:hypothetical protein
MSQQGRPNFGHAAAKNPDRGGQGDLNFVAQ